MARKTTKAPTIEERLSGLHATTAAALSIFESAATDLEAARDEAHEIAKTVADEISRLRDVLDAAEDHAAYADAKAAKIRGFIG